MGPKGMSSYEKLRLENMRRNAEMLAALNVRSHANQLSKLSKPPTRLPNNSSKKKRKPLEPIRRSTRNHGLSVHDSDATELKQLKIKSPKKQKAKPVREPEKEKESRGPVPFSLRDAYVGKGSDERFVDLIKHFTRKCEMGVIDLDGSLTERDTKKEEVGAPYCEAVKAENVVLGSAAGEHVDTNFKTGVSGSDSFDEWDLKPQNVAAVGSTRITTFKFVPSTNRTVVVVGTASGEVGFWDVGVQADGEGSNGIFMYDPHSAPVSAIVIEPFAISKIYTSSRDGYIRLMDMERELFDLVCLTDYPIYSMSARPQDSYSLYFSEALGEFDIWDLRAGKSPTTWNLHECKINSIDFSSQNTNVMATSSSDCTAAIWDLRYIRADSPVPLNIIKHDKPVHSAYFSPSGKFLATSSSDDFVGISSGANFEDLSMIEHENYKNVPLRGIWGWDDSYIFIGNVRRKIDVISVAGKKTIAKLKSKKMTSVPVQLDAHRCTEGMLAGASVGNTVSVWTSN